MNQQGLPVSGGTGRTASLKRAQERDPKTGRPLIETILAYNEPVPPPPPPKKPSLNKPMPWKLKAKKDHEEVKKLNQVMTQAVLEKTVTASEAKPIGTAAPPANDVLLKHLPVGAMENRPYCMGSIRLVKEEKAAPFSRDISPESLMKKRVPGYGCNPMPTDGRRPAPVVVDADPDVNPVTFQKRPVPQEPMPAKTKDEPKQDIFGHAIPLRPPPAPVLPLPLCESIAQKPGTSTSVRIGGNFDNLMFAPKRTTLVEAAKALVSSRPVFADPEVATDIFGQPQKHSPSKNVFRQSMFPGDAKPIQIFGEAPSLEPKTTQTQRMVSAFPTYISNPPDNTQHLVKDLVEAKIRQKQNTSQHQQSEPVLAIPPSKASDSFYKGPLYQRFLVACGPWGVRRLRHLLRGADKDGDGVLSRFECKSAFVKLGMELDDVELSEIMMLAPVSPAPPAAPAVVATAGPSPLPSEAFIPRLMEVLRKGDLSVKRQQVAVQCFTALCKTALKTSFNITLDDIVNTTDFAEHPRFEAHVRGALRELMNGFVASWGSHKQRTCVISQDEFVDFYHDFSPLISADRDFERFLRAMHGLKNSK
jgi:hypothetical protein